MKLPRRSNFCIWPRALPRCRPCRASHGRKPIRRGRCASSLATRRRRDRRHGSSDRSAAVGAAWPAIRHRQPAGRWQQYRHRGGREVAAGRLYAPSDLFGQRDQRDASTTSLVSISSATSRRSPVSPVRHSSWRSIHRCRQRPFPSSSPMPRLIRARSAWRRTVTARLPMLRASYSR